MMHSMNGADSGGEEHRRKITRKKQKKIRRVQHWCNCKLYIKYAWYEFRAMMKG